MLSFPLPDNLHHHPETAVSTVATRKEPAHFMYFPDHYRWSAEMLAILGTAPCGGANFSEAHRIGRQLRACVGDDEAWFRAWTEGGDRLLAVRQHRRERLLG